MRTPSQPIPRCPTSLLRGAEGGPSKGIHTHRRKSELHHVQADLQSMNRKFIGNAAKIMDSSKSPGRLELTPVPVARAADSAKSGVGRIILSSESPTTLKGIDTKFTSQVKPKSTIMLPKFTGYATASVEEVISDTEIRLKAEFVVPSKEGSTDVKASGKIRIEGESKEGLEYKVLPYVDQEETYGAVFRRLNEGGAIGVFPEGEPLRDSADPRWIPRSNRFPSSQSWLFHHGPRRHGRQP